jgi:hypothetical protein
MHRTRIQMICAAAGALAVGAVVALSPLVREEPGESPDLAELPGGPPGQVVAERTPTTSSAAPTGTTTAVASTASPAPRPSTPGRPAGRPAGWPGPANTGVVPGTALTVVTGDQTFSGTGETIVGKEFRGFVRVTGKNITFRNCIFRGRATSGNNALLDTEQGTNTVIEDSEFVPANPAATIDNIAARNTSIYRANIHGGVDGVKANRNTLIQDSWIHDMTWFASDPNQGGGATHNDGVQSFAGEFNVVLRHNRIDMSTTKNANAAWQSSARDSRAENNLLDGGGCTLNFAHGSAGSIGGIAVVGNRFGRNSFFDCPILLSTQANLAQNSGNVWADTGTPIPPPQRHD